MPWLKSIIFLLCLLPAVQLGWLAWAGQLGANPVETLQHETGEWALRLLWITLAMTPLRKLIGKPWPIRIRRMLGLYAYFYMCLHFASYVVFDLELDFGALSEDILKRTWITVGFACWLLLLPLAITSTNGWQRRLGRRWKKLHRLIYPAAILAALHFLWQEKVLAVEPLVYAAILAALLLLRVKRKRNPQINGDA